MKPNQFEIYNSKKFIGVLPGTYIDKTEFCEKHLLISNSYKIIPGFIIIANKQEKLYVTDVRLNHSDNNKIEVYYETEGEHISNQMKFRHDWKITIFNVIGGSLAGLITSFLFWLITT